MPRLIFKCPHIKAGAPYAAHRSHYVDYVATREGVQHVTPDVAGLPATKKQKDMIARLLHDFPLSRGLFEYEDYQTAPTQGNASEFISRAIEDNLGQLAMRRDYVDYIAKRPRAQRIGTHGLFTGSDEPVALSWVAETIARHPGTLWLPILSLRREDASRLDYDNAETWRFLLSGYAAEMASAMKIPLEHFRWYAAFHDESHHPHVHMVCYSTDPSEGFLTKEGITQIKSRLVKRIFRQELNELYAAQTKRRNALTGDARAAMRALIEKMGSGVLVNARVEQLMAHLSQRLRPLSGKKQYGYLKADLKNVVDEIVDELARDGRVAEAYRLWYELREEVLRSYKDDLPERLPLSRQKEFKQIKNMVIQEALRLDSAEYVEEMDEPEEDAVPEEERLDAAPPDDESPPPSEDGNGYDPRVEWSEEYEHARILLYGNDKVPRDLDEAFRMFAAEAEHGNALAMHDLARMLADGLGCEIDPEASYAWYKRALAVFHMAEEEKPGRYLQYRIGKFYAWGLGTDQDYSEAADWFTRSAGKGYKYAQYSLAGLYRDGKGVDQDSERAFGLYELAAVQQFPYASFEAGKMCRDGVGTEKDSARAEEHFRDAYHGFAALEEKNHDDKLQYRLGWMLLHGVGVEQDVTAARAYFEDSAKLGNTNAQYQLAKLILADTDASQTEIDMAVTWLEKLADSGQSIAQYALAKLLRDGGSVEKDLTRAVALFTAAAKQGSDCAAYALGKLYQDGKELPKDIDSAVRWLTQSAEAGNQFAQYRLGKLYLLGKDVERDKEAAIHWFERSAAQGNEYAQYFLDHMDDVYTVPLPVAATRLLHHLSQIFRENDPKVIGQPEMRFVDRKLLRKIREKKLAQGHKRDDHEPVMQY